MRSGLILNGSALFKAVLRYARVIVPTNGCKSPMYCMCRVVSVLFGYSSGCRSVSWYVTTRNLEDA
jgi:hypothetical protein